MAVTTSRLNGLPRLCASMIALVFGEMAASIFEASMLCVARSTSTKTGTAPNCRIGFTVVGKPAATPMTSSPGLTARSPRRSEVSVENATRFADDPELTVIKYLTPRNAARRSSNIALKRPVVSQPSRLASTISWSSLAPITLPDTGTVLSPGTNGRGACTTSENCCTRADISARSWSGVFLTKWRGASIIVRWSSSRVCIGRSASGTARARPADRARPDAK